MIQRALLGEMHTYWSEADTEQEMLQAIGQVLALYPTGGDTVARLIRNADLAMYNAKNRHNGQFISYSRGMEVEPSRHLTFEREIHQALESHQFEVYYQPQVYLRKLPIHRLKIDRSFVKNIDKGRTKGCIIPAFISMATELGLGIVAEGVETKEQRDYLESHQCSLMQGFLFSPAVSAAEVARLLEKNAFSWSA